jgi:hypothetical protein
MKKISTKIGTLIPLFIAIAFVTLPQQVEITAAATSKPDLRLVPSPLGGQTFAECLNEESRGEETIANCEDDFCDEPSEFNTQDKCEKISKR